MPKFEGEPLNVLREAPLKPDQLRQDIVEEQVKRGHLDQAEHFAVLQKDETVLTSYLLHSIEQGRIDRVEGLTPHVQSMENVTRLVEALVQHNQPVLAREAANRFVKKIDTKYFHNVYTKDRYGGGGGQYENRASEEQEQQKVEQLRHLIVTASAPEAVFHISSLFSQRENSERFADPLWQALGEMKFSAHDLTNYLQSLGDQGKRRQFIESYYRGSAERKSPENLSVLITTLEKLHGRDEAIKNYGSVYGAYIALNAERVRVDDIKNLSSEERIKKLNELYGAGHSSVHIYLAAATTSAQEWNQFIKSYSPEEQAKMTMLADWYRARRALGGKEAGPIVENATTRVLESIDTGNMETLQTSLDTLLALRTPDASVRLTRILGKHLEAGGDITTTLRLCRTLAGMESFKANTVLASLIRQEYTPEILSRYLIRLLVENGHFDENLRGYFRDKAIEEKKAGEIYPRQAVGRFRGLMRAMGINPDAAIMLYAESRDEAALQEGFQNIEAETKLLTEKGGYQEQSSWLLGDVNRRLLYFLRYGGRTSFSLINDYNFNKFTHVLQMGENLEIHPGPIQNFSDALAAKHGSDQGKHITDRIAQGQFPFVEPGKEAVWDITVDANRESQVEQARFLAGSCLGKNELGKLAQAMMYHKFLDQLPAERRQASLEGLWQRAGENFGALDTFLATCQQTYGTEVENLDAPRLLSKASVPELPLNQAIQDEVVDVVISRFEDGLRGVGKKMANELRQLEKSGKLTREERDTRLANLEQPENILPSLLANELPPHFSPVIGEWKSHIEGALRAVREARIVQKGGTQTRHLRVRFLDKTNDLPEYLRLADSAQCCFTSKNFGGSSGPQQYIARIWKDPMSFVYHIEEPSEEGTEKRNSVGFVFGSYSLNRKNEPTLVLNGVYMDRKTDLAAQKVLGVIERHHAKPLGSSEMLVASQHAGSTNLGGEYENTKDEYLRLRAIKERYGDNPEQHTYDDIGLIAVDAKEGNISDTQAINRWAKAGKHVFRKTIG